MIQPYLRYWLATLYLSSVGIRTMTYLLEHFQHIESIFQATEQALAALSLTPVQVQSILNPDWRAVERDLAWAKTSNHHIITRDDDDYPKLLKEIHDAPLLLFVLGDKTRLQLPQLAMVGARHASPLGLQMAEQFAAQLVQSGYVVTSGLALGIDGASHRGALRGKGVTIAVAGTGLKHTYPSSHHALAHEIVNSGGAIVSEFPLDTGPHASNFPRRNRIISGLSQGVLVVEAALKSGSMITVKYALEQGREVFAIPGSIHHPLSRGCHHLIRQGAKLVETAKDIVEELGGFAAVTAPNPVKTSPIPLEWQQILDLVGYELTPLDMIMYRSGLTLAQISSILLRLEMHGYIHAVASGYIRKQGE